MTCMTSLMYYSILMGWTLSGREHSVVASFWRYTFVWSLMSVIYATIPRSNTFLYQAMPSKLRWLTRGVVVARYFSEILLHCSISFINIVYNSTFCSNSLSSRFPLSFLVFASIVSRETPALFCLGWGKQMRLDYYLFYSVMRIVWSFPSSWRFPCRDTSLDL